MSIGDDIGALTSARREVQFAHGFRGISQDAAGFLDGIDKAIGDKIRSIQPNAAGCAHANIPYNPGPWAPGHRGQTCPDCGACVLSDD